MVDEDTKEDRLQEEDNSESRVVVVEEDNPILVDKEEEDKHWAENTVAEDKWGDSLTLEKEAAVKGGLSRDKKLHVEEVVVAQSSGQLEDDLVLLRMVEPMVHGFLLVY